MIQDLAKCHAPGTDLFRRPASPDQWACWRLRDDQIESFRREGYLAGVRVLSDEQVDVLRRQLEGLFDPNHPGHDLFHEYHSNESTDPSMVLFHALGAWRVAPAFHDLLWDPAFLVPASQLLGGPVRFWQEQDQSGEACRAPAGVANDQLPLPRRGGDASVQGVPGHFPIGQRADPRGDRSL